MSINCAAHDYVRPGRCYNSTSAWRVHIHSMLTGGNWILECTAVPGVGMRSPRIRGMCPAERTPNSYCMQVQLVVPAVQAEWTLRTWVGG